MPPAVTVAVRAAPRPRAETCVDPRPVVLRGVAHRAVPFDPADAPYYDLIVGLHPDQVTRAVAAARCRRR